MEELSCLYLNSGVVNCLRPNFQSVQWRSQAARIIVLVLGGLLQSSVSPRSLTLPLLAAVRCFHDQVMRNASSCEQANATSSIHAMLPCYSFSTQQHVVVSLNKGTPI